MELTLGQKVAVTATTTMSMNVDEQTKAVYRYAVNKPCEPTEGVYLGYRIVCEGYTPFTYATRRTFGQRPLGKFHAVRRIRMAMVQMENAGKYTPPIMVTMENIAA